MPEPGPLDLFVGMIVPVMGWSWACYVAHTTLQSIIEMAPCCPPSARWMDGVPLVQPLLKRFVHWLYIDNFGVGTLEDQEQGTEPGPDSEIVRIAKECRQVVAAAGLTVHKVETSSGIRCLWELLWAGSLVLLDSLQER